MVKINDLILYMLLNVVNKILLKGICIYVLAEMTLRTASMCPKLYSDNTRGAS